MSSPAGHAPQTLILASTGDLDTSRIISWLSGQYGSIALDLGHPDDRSQIEAKALASPVGSISPFGLVRGDDVYRQANAAGFIHVFGPRQQVAAQHDRRLLQESLEIAR